MIPGGQNKMSAAIKFVESHRAGALFLIVVLGFALRIHGIAGTGFNEDEIFKLQASRAYLRGDFSQNLEHPMLLKSLVAGSLKLSDIWNRKLGRFGPLPEEFAVRLPNVAVGALTAVVVFAVAEQFFGFAVGLIGALFWSVGTIAIMINRVAKEDTLLVFFAWLGYYFYIRAKKASLTDPERSVRWYTASGSSFGLMLASKYFPHYLGLISLYYYVPQNRRKYPSLGWRGNLALLGMFSLAFAIANPAIFLPNTLKYMFHYAGEGTMTHRGYLAMGQFYFDDPAHLHGGMPFYFYPLILAVKTPIPVLLALAVGLVEIARRRREEGATFLLVMFLFWIVPFSILSAKWLRWMLSWMPTIYIIGAVGVVRIFSWLAELAKQHESRQGWITALTAALTLVFLALPVFSATQANPFYSLYLNPFGLGRSGYYFPHDELDDIGLRPAVDQICHVAPAGSTVVAEALPVISYYFHQCGRNDLRYVDLSNVAPESLSASGYLVVQEGRKYLDNIAIVRAVESAGSPAWTVMIGRTRAATVYQSSQLAELRAEHETSFSLR
jgi:Dolichyl-phosphate-mannose-protein mannosyltransferase/Alg9-like mannosyltransferase family